MATATMRTCTSVGDSPSGVYHCILAEERRKPREKRKDPENLYAILHFVAALWDT